MGGAVLANENFDIDDDPAQPGVGTQQVAVPGQDSPVDSAMEDSYRRALEQAQRSGNFNLVQQLMQSRNSAAPVAVASVSPTPSASTGELPFTLLEEALDRDQDGLSDNDEISLATNASNADTDGDSYIDGLEVIRGYNPLIASPNDKIAYQEPKQFNEAVYKITGLRLAGSGEQEQLTVTGTGPENSLVALLVMGGQNRLWVARTDKTGRFMYVSRDTLDLGNYKIYAAAVSANGQVLAASRALMFARTIDALVKIEPTPTPVINNENEDNKIPTAGIIGTVAGAAGLVIGVWLWRIIRRRRQMKKNPLLLI